MRASIKSFIPSVPAVVADADDDVHQSLGAPPDAAHPAQPAHPAQQTAFVVVDGVVALFHTHSPFPSAHIVPALAAQKIVTQALAAAQAAQAVQTVFAEELVAFHPSPQLFEIVPLFVIVPVA